MRDFHQVIIHHIGKVICWKAVRFEQHLVVQLGVINADPTVNMVFEAGAAAFGDALAHDGPEPLAQPLPDLSVRQQAAGVAGDVRMGGQVFAFGFVIFLAEAVIRRAFRDEFIRVFLVNRQALALDVGSFAAVFIRSLVVADASQCQPVINRGERGGHIAGLVGIFNAQNEHARVFFCQQISIEGGA